MAQPKHRKKNKEIQKSNDGSMVGRGVTRPDMGADEHAGGALMRRIDPCVATVSMGEVLRMGRYLNVILGSAVAIMPCFVDDRSLPMNTSSALAGMAVAVLSIPRGLKKEKYGIWDKYVR